MRGGQVKGSVARSSGSNRMSEAQASLATLNQRGLRRNLQMKRYDSLGFAALLCLSATSAFAHATPTTLHTANAESFTAYVDGPKDAQRGVVLVHDWFGVSPFYTQAVEK